ncbi:MAG: ABC transporter substrate-binding protein [Hyphomicrobiaceae bacterium]|nr:ABC transporter substrate-binding protein [Hyphomicrobiaceae bacterium]
MRDRFGGARARRAFGLAASIFAIAATADPLGSQESPLPIVVGLATPLTGRAAATGAAQRAALEAAILRINETGGVIGRPVVLAVADDTCSRSGAVRAQAELAAAQADVIVGHPCPAASDAAAPLYARAGTLLIAAGNRHPSLTAKPAGPLVFRASGRDDRQGTDAADRLAAIAGGGTIAILHDRTAMARAVVQGTLHRLNEIRGPNGAARTLVTGIVAGETDYARAVDAVAASGAAAVLFAGFPAEAAILIRLMRARGITAALLLSASNATPELVAHAGGALAEHVEVMLPSAAGAAAGQDESAASGQHNTPEDIAAADARLAVTAWAAAVAAAQTASAEAVARELSAVSPAGAIAFDARRDAVTRSFAPYRWTGNGWRIAGS